MKYLNFSLDLWWTSGHIITAVVFGEQICKSKHKANEFVCKRKRQRSREWYEWKRKMSEGERNQEKENWKRKEGARVRKNIWNQKKKKKKKKKGG